MPGGSPDSWTWRWPTGSEIAWGFSLFILTAGLSLAATAWVFVNLPANYFVGPKSPAFWSNLHPFLRWFGRVGKNLLGGILVIVGIILALPGVPGQGILTILLGLMFLDLPGKRKIEQRLVQTPRILRLINGLRKRYRRPELVFDSPETRTI